MWKYFVAFLISIVYLASHALHVQWVGSQWIVPKEVFMASLSAGFNHRQLGVISPRQQASPPIVYLLEPVRGAVFAYEIKESFARTASTAS